MEPVINTKVQSWLRDQTQTSRGNLIVFEGLDRSGKSTQCLRLVDTLRESKMKVQYLRFPNRDTPIGRTIDRYLTSQTYMDDHAIHLLFSANRWEAAENIRSLIASGTTVIIDRYYYSGCVYSAAKGIDLNWCRKPEVGLPRPDLCLFLDLSSEVAAQRGGYGTERYETRGIQDRVRELFEEMMAHRDESEDFAVVDASGSLEDVELAILRTIKDRLFVNPPEYALRSIQPW